MIYESFGNKTPSSTTANLLYTAIVANTLNFKANLTTGRDRAAAEKLKQYISLPADWIEKYYEDVEKHIISDLKTAIKNDTKDFANGWSVWQLELYNADKLIHQAPFSQHGFGIICDIKNGIDYLFCGNPEIKLELEKHLNAKFNGNIGRTDALYLRKEIAKIMKL